MDEEKKGSLLDLEGERVHQICSFMWTDNFWIMSHTQDNLETNLQDLIEEASRWNLEPKPASLRWTSASESEEKSDIIWDASRRCCVFLLKTRSYVVC